METEEETREAMVMQQNNMTVQKKKKKTSLGRRKIEIKKILNPSNRQVTFSKRRVGLFKKASELCILSGAEIAIIVHSLGKRVFSFGHPTTDAVIDRLLGEEKGSLHQPPVPVAAHDYNRHYANVCREMEAEKRRREAIEGARSRDWLWWNDDVDGLDLEELEQYAAALDELIKNVTMKANDYMVMHSSTSLLAAAPPTLDVDVDQMMRQRQVTNQVAAGGAFDYESFVNLPNVFGQL